MAISSLRFSSLSLHPHSFLLPRLLQFRSELSFTVSSSVSPHRLRSRRKNHLRPKIPKSPLPPSISPPPQPLEHFDSSSYADGSALLVVEEVEEAKETFASFEVSDVSTPGADYRWFPWSVLDLAARFAVLLVVQTAVAVWFLGREDGKEGGGRSNEDGLKENKKVINAEKGMVVEDFEKMVAEIREMASKARAREAEGIVNGGGVEDDEGDHKGLGRTKKSIARIFMDGQGDGFVQKEKPRKLRLRNGGAGYFPKGKGFGGSKIVQSGKDLGKGGTQHITYSNPAKESKTLPVPTKSNAQTSYVKQKSFENENIKRVPKKLSCVNTERISPKIKIEESKYAFESNDSSPIEDSQNNQSSSMVLTSNNDRDRESISGPHESQWWLKLQYVFGVLLHRGSENIDRGLYSLPIAHDGKKHSYTITFQDRGDAMNFSFLLEYFFEDLGNVNADIVPLTIHELDDAISAGELKLIVVRKGQLRLYAGQPLAEVENTLRSLLE